MYCTICNIISSDYIYNCKYCNKNYNKRQHRWRHEQLCNLKPLNKYDGYRCLSSVSFKNLSKIINKNYDILQDAIKQNDPLIVFKKLFLDSVSNNLYPIALFNGKYRYLNDKKELVEDNGEMIIKKIYINSHNILIYINLHIIKDKEDYIDYLYNTYNLKLVQYYLLKSCYNSKLFKQIKCNFNKIIANNNHPFFKGCNVIKSI